MVEAKVEAKANPIFLCKCASDCVTLSNNWEYNTIKSTFKIIDLV